MKAIQGEIPEITVPGVRVRTKTIKKRFVTEYLKNGGNATRAVQKVNKNLTYDSARTIAVRLMKRDDVQLAIQWALEETSIDYKYVLQSRKKFVDVGINQLEEGRKENELFVSPKDVHSHLLGIEGILGRLGEGASQSPGGSLHIHIDASDHQGLLEKRRELMGFFTGITEDVQPIEQAEVVDEHPPQSQDPQVQPEPSK